MKRFQLYAFALVFVLSFVPFQKSSAQTCSGILSNGQNLVTNYDFTQGYSDWSHDPAYIEFTPCGSSCYSVPGRIYAGNNSIDFNQAFKMPDNISMIPDHSPSSDNMMLLVDGICQPNINLWSQSGIPIVANTNYYFSIWVTTLEEVAPYGSLKFNINGVDQGAINAPGTVGQWVKYTVVWNSGLTPPPTATISIQNTTLTGCQNAVDFAVDDITFTPGCDFGTPGPSPALGPDQSICGKTVPFNINAGLSAAAQARPDITYTWFKDGVQQTTGMGPSFYSFAVSTAGTYAVCVDSAGSCPKTDLVNITSNYTIDLGPDLVLCTPTTALLDAVYTGPGVTYQWSMDGNPIPGASGRTLSVTMPGTFSVVVTDPVCGVQSDALIITSTAAVPVNGTYCPVTSGGTGATSLSVTGTGKYKWYDAFTGGNVVAKGSSYAPTGLTGAGPHTFYVEDTSTFNMTAGPSATANNPSSGSAFGSFINPYNVNPGSSEGLLIFNAIQDFKLDTISVLVNNYYCQPGTMDNVTIEVRYPTSMGGGHVPGSPKTITSQCTIQNNGGIPARIMKLPLGFDLPQGNGYQMRLGTGNAILGFLNATNGGSLPTPVRYAYPTTYTYAGDPVVEFASNSAANFNLYYAPTAFPGYFDWKITKGISCDRVPVSAIQYCPNCVGAVAPTSASVDVSSYCVGSVTDINLSVTGGSGDNLVWYEGSCGGTQVATNTTGATVTIPAPTVTTTYFARWESTGCNSTCASVTVTPRATPTVANAGTVNAFCNTTSANMTANTPAVGTGLWSIISGTGTIANYTNPTTAVTNIGAGDLVLEWTISNAPCTPSSSQVTIHRDTLPAPVFSLSGMSFDTCANTTGVVYSTTVNHAPNSTYTWSTTGTLNITGQTANTVTVSVGATGGTIRLDESFGTCTLSATRTVTISTPVSAPNAGLDRALCTNSTSLNATSPSVGTGVWSVSSGTGTFSNINSPTSGVTGLSNGTNTFTWTVNGCGGPLSDNVDVVVGASTLLMDLSGPSDTLCVGSGRDLQARVTGGSGQYTYYWSSKDNSFLQTNTSSYASVSPNVSSNIYYVYASDDMNSGCNSNTDSVTIYSVVLQELIVPNLITPNGDQANDELLMRDTNMNKLLPNAQLEIVNRWGDIVYRNTNYDNTWKAEGLSDGIYYYHLKSGCGDKVYKGWLQIIR